ncbi:peptidoglycan DD-metalloendopeptidase family protein [Borrelia sp. CA_690]|uniref:M23 family metallopeptidase n=1 Tax=Borrelia maritima TaxID=2761123 RepID=A0A5J6WCG2_9SPIR|nr:MULTISPECIES: M23 family metallopeptidase [Borrelia]QFI14397.1 M23 family metallopeptidase [Borrelia maritima]WKC84253.1 M23 family metallopeptidase [Borrelia sp. CA_690]
MIISKNKQRVEKRKKKTLFNDKKSVNFELKDFANIRNVGKRRKKVFKLKNFFKRVSLFFYNLKIQSINHYEYKYYYKSLIEKVVDIFSMLNYRLVFKLNAIIFVFILIFYINIFSYYGSYVFLNRLTLPKDYFIDTFLYYSDQDIAQISSYLLESDVSANVTGFKKNFVLKVFDHKIKPGETLSHVAARYQITSETLISFNEIKDVRSIKPNSIIKVPNMKGIVYVVKKNDSISSIASVYNVPKVDILDSNNLDNEVLFLGQKLFIPGGRLPKDFLKEVLGETFMYPVQGIITSGYGYRPDPFTGVISFHNGIDIANLANTPIKASREGIVVTVGFNAGGYGKYIVISHSNGFQTLYAHLNSFAVKVGKKVSRGAVIGYMGSTGYSTGNHLHFTIFKNGKTENPMKYLR